MEDFCSIRWYVGENDQWDGAEREKVISHDTAVFDSNDLESVLLELYLL